MSKLLTIPTYSRPVATEITNTQLAADKRKKAQAVLKRLRAGQGLCKIVLAEGIGWRALTEIIYEFLDWQRANCYILGNRRAA